MSNGLRVHVAGGALTTSASVRWSEQGDPPPSIAELRGHLAIGVRGFFSSTECAAWARAIRAARAEWTADFGREQFSFGRAFYTHFEQGRSKLYFDDAAASDARVERRLPGFQRRMRDLVGALTGGQVRPRRGWCGPGVHVFPAGENVARSGGVVHFDTEGLTGHQLARRSPAISVVAMIQPPRAGGGLKLWDFLRAGSEEAGRDALRRPSLVVPYAAGDAVIFDSYRLHQIQPFGGRRARISATVHAAEIDAGGGASCWETWF